METPQITRCTNCKNFNKNPTFTPDSEIEMAQLMCQEPTLQGAMFLLQATNNGLLRLTEGNEVIILDNCPYFDLKDELSNEIMISLIPLLLNTQEEV